MAYKSCIMIAQVGQGNYKITEYVDGNSIGDNSQEGIKTGYTFEASYYDVINRYNIMNNNLILVGTDTSYWGNICWYFYEKKLGEQLEKKDARNIIDELKKIKSKEGYTYFEGVEFSIDKKINNENIKIENIGEKNILDRLGFFLSDYIEISQRKIKVKVVLVKHGINTSELDENFDVLYGATEELLKTINIDNDDTDRNYIVFDISNGYRSIPIYIYNFYNYLLRLRDDKEYELGMYYGMFEAQYDYEMKAPLVRMDSVNELMQWINAANEFINYGAIREIVKIMNSIMNSLDENDVEHDDIKEIIKNFKNFDYATNANNLLILKESIDFICGLSDRVDEIKCLHVHSKVLLKKISNVFSEEFVQSNKRNQKLRGDYSYAYLTIHMANWYLKQERIGNAAIALQEGVTTFIMERWPEISNRYITYKHNQRDPQQLWNNSLYYDEADLNFPQRWIAEHDVRDYISFFFKDTRTNANLDDSILDFKEKMKKVRTKIRNPEAHILITNSTEQEISNARNALINLINIMLKVVSADDNEEENILDIFKYDSAYQYHRFVSFISNLNEIVLDANNEYINDLWYIGWERLVEQMHEYNSMYNQIVSGHISVDDVRERLRELNMIMGIRERQSPQFDKEQNDQLDRMFGNNGRGIHVNMSVSNYILNTDNGRFIYSLLINQNGSAN